MDRTNIIEDLKKEFAYFAQGEGDWLIDGIADFVLSRLQWKDVADGLPEVSGEYVTRFKHGKYAQTTVFYTDDDSRNWWLRNVAAYIPYPIPPFGHPVKHRWKP